MIMTIVMAIMANTFKANNRSIAMQKISENGNYALEQIKRYYLSQSVCDETILTIDVGTKVLKLNTNELTKNEVVASDLSVGCSGNMLNVGFTLSTGTDRSKEYQSSKSFTTAVVLRN